MISLGDTLVVLAAGVLAGVVGTGGAIASLVSYPALLAIGLPALTANVTNIVALVALGPGAAVASRPELRGRGPWIRRAIPVTAAGGDGSGVAGGAGVAGAGAAGAGLGGEVGASSERATPTATVSANNAAAATTVG